MTDVLIIGGGLAGWRAAEAAANAGVSVTLVANGDGNSPHIHALNCPVRADDSVERMIEDTMSSGHGTNDPALVRVLCEGAAKLKDEFAFDRDERGEYLAIQPLGSSVPRCVSIDHAIGAIALRQIKTRLAGKVRVVKGRVTELRREGASVMLAERPCSAASVMLAERPRSAPPATLAERHRSAAEIPSPRFPGNDRYQFSFVNVSHGERVDRWELSNCVYHVCFRLADSVTQNEQNRWTQEREAILSQASQSGDDNGSWRHELWLLSKKVDDYLDAGHGECILSLPGVAEIVRETVFHDNGKLYAVHAVGIMGNHVHVLVQPLEGCQLLNIVSQWKSVTAHRINHFRATSGQVWREDFYNRIVRDRSEYENQVLYVYGNDGVWSWKMPARWRAGNVGESFEANEPLAGFRREYLPAEGCLRSKSLEQCAPVTLAACPRSAPPEPLAERPRSAAFLATLANGLLLSSRSVVLATGGWCGRYDFSTNPPYLRGDGIALAQSLGAATRDMDAVQYEPTVRVEGPRRGVPVITTLLYKGATLRNLKGEEFLKDKHANKDEMSKAIFSEIAAQGEDALPTVRDGTAQGEDALPTVGAESCGKGVLALAQKIGVLYDLSLVSEADLRACKMDPAERRILVAPAAHTSLGGVVIDTHCRVLRTDGSPIPGLFAAGEVTGGLHGRNRLGGNAGTEVMVFGRIAGESAADFVRREGAPVTLAERPHAAEITTNQAKDTLQ